MEDRLFLGSVSLDLWLTGQWFRFAVGPASHVSSPSSRLTTVSSRYVLMESSSFAIWNMQKVVVALSAAIWVTNFAVLISCELYSSIV